MEQKTKVTAEEGKQEILITREFDLPLDLLFRAYTEAELFEEWMNTKVIKLQSAKHGSYHFVTTDPKGNQHVFTGVIHDFVPEKKIVRTFEMENQSLGVQLEFYEFEKITADTSRLRMRVLYETTKQRDELLKLPFAFGINMAHNRIEEIMKNKKK